MRVRATIQHVYLGREYLAGEVYEISPSQAEALQGFAKVIDEDEPVPTLTPPVAKAEEDKTEKTPVPSFVPRYNRRDMQAKK